MDSKNQRFEDVVRQRLMESEVTPTARVLRNLKFRLGISDFFSVNPRKVNILYTGILAAGIAGFLILNQEAVKEEPAGEALSFKEEISGADRKVKPEVPIESEAGPAVETDMNLLPSADFEINTMQGCAPLTIVFHNQSQHASRYSWDFGNGEESDEKNPEYTYTKPGKYTARLTAVGQGGEEASYEQEIEVLKSPLAEFSIDVDNSRVENRKIQFRNESVGAAEYAWEFGDKEESTTGTPVHVYDDYGTYQVELVAKAKNGCTDTARLVNKFIEKNYTLSFPLNFRPNPYSHGANGYYERAGSDASIFYPENQGVKEYQLTIQTPGGLEVFSTKDIKQGWNGYIGGRLAPRGIYNYEAKGIYPNGQPFHLAGRFKVIGEDSNFNF